MLGRGLWRSIIDLVYLAIRPEVFAKTGGRCWYCGGQAQNVDHFFPRSKFKTIGKWDVRNLVPCCYACNQRKKDLMPDVAFPDRPIWFVRTLGLSDPTLDQFGVKTPRVSNKPERPKPALKLKDASRGGSYRQSGEGHAPSTLETYAKKPNRGFRSLVTVRHPQFGLIRIDVQFAIEHPEWERIPWNAEP